MILVNGTTSYIMQSSSGAQQYILCAALQSRQETFIYKNGSRRGDFMRFSVYAVENGNKNAPGGSSLLFGSRFLARQTAVAIKSTCTVKQLEAPPTVLIKYSDTRDLGSSTKK